MRTLSLSFHRDYACQRTGRCCTSGWDIPVEVRTSERLQRALDTGGLSLPSGPSSTPLLWFPAPADGYAATLDHDDDGRCAAFEPALPGGSCACAIHRQIGPDALPASCRLFPRVAVIRPFSTAVSLSHYCPTAATLLCQEDGPVSIETDAPPFRDETAYEGLDLRGALPPLVRPDALFGWVSFERWERFVVQSLTDERRTMAAGFGVVIAAAERIRSWTSECGDLDEWVEHWLTGTDHGPPPPATLTQGQAAAAYAWATASIPAGMRVSDEPSLREGRDSPPLDLPCRLERPVRRYLAARAWASWIGHDGQGVRSFVRWLWIVLGVLAIELDRGGRNGADPTDVRSLAEAIGRTDLLLVHLLAPRRLARRLAVLEARPLSVPDLLPQRGRP